ncbi:MAG: DGQHR domain-containing protein [Pyrinomonadaceae bacterium]
MPTRKAGNRLPRFEVIAGTCLGHKAYRGFGSLDMLASLSKADVFDQEKNRLGTQRNLSAQHARKAYQYVAGKESAFFPEIILNVRDTSYVKFNGRKGKGGTSFGSLQFVKDPRTSKTVVVSRLDGNHRLWFADGHEKGFDAVARPVSFCFLLMTDLDQELELFRDINDNQMGMNTSHLQNITARLLGEKALKLQNPAAYIVQRLQKDATSPLHRRMHEGGQVRKGATLQGLTVANLTNAVRDMLSRSAKLSQFPDADVQLKVIKNYWNAVRKWLPDAWKNPNDYIIFKGVGLYAISYLGIEIIDRCLLRGKYSTKDMLTYLRQLPETDLLRSKGNLAYAGRSGGRKLANDLIADLEEEGEISLSNLQKMILSNP